MREEGTHQPQFCPNPIRQTEAFAPLLLRRPWLPSVRLLWLGEDPDGLDLLAGAEEILHRIIWWIGVP